MSAKRGNRIPLSRQECYHKSKLALVGCAKLGIPTGMSERDVAGHWHLERLRLALWPIWACTT